MKKLSDIFYGSLPWLFLLGIPIAICIVIAVVAWPDEIAVVWALVIALGEGSALLGLFRSLSILVLVATTIIGAFWALNKMEHGKAFWLIAYLLLLFEGFSSFAQAVLIGG